MATTDSKKAFKSASLGAKNAAYELIADLDPEYFDKLKGFYVDGTFGRDAGRCVCGDRRRARHHWPRLGGALRRRDRVHTQGAALSQRTCGNQEHHILYRARAAPMAINAQIAVIGRADFAASARVPTHAVPSDPPGGL